MSESASDYLDMLLRDSADYEDAAFRLAERTQLDGRDAELVLLLHDGKSVRAISRRFGRRESKVDDWIADLRRRRTKMRREGEERRNTLDALVSADF